MGQTPEEILWTQAARATLNDIHSAGTDDIVGSLHSIEVAAVVVPWERLQAALLAMDDWYGVAGVMSAYVGVNSRGSYFAGAHYDGESWPDSDYEQYGYQVDGTTAAEVIDDLVQRFADYRKDKDAEREADAEAL